MADTITEDEKKTVMPMLMSLSGASAHTQFTKDFSKDSVPQAAKDIAVKYDLARPNGSRGAGAAWTATAAGLALAK